MSQTMFASSAVSPQEDSGGFMMDDVIRMVQAGHSEAAQQLRETLGKGIGWYLRRHLKGANADEALKQVLEMVIDGVVARRLFVTSDAVSFARFAAHGILERYSAQNAASPPAPNRSDVHRMRQAMGELSAPDREALSRYYEGQSSEGICNELEISDSALKALKSRVTTRCMELGHARKSEPRHGLGKVFHPRAA